MEKAFDFIHVGMGKCMSTTLQKIWADADNYQLVAATPLKTAVEEKIRKYQGRPQELENALSRLKINSNQPSGATGRARVNVLSCEGLTMSFLVERDLGGHIRRKTSALASNLARHTNHVLMMIRNPLEWIISAHAQHVKEGGVLDLDEYVVEYEQVLSANTDLASIVSEWNEGGVPVTLLTVESYKRDPRQFWESYETRLGCSAPHSNEKHSGLNVNKTRYDRLEINRRLNEIFAVVEASLTKSRGQDAEICQLLSKAKKWGTRIGVEFARDEEFQKMKTLLGITDEFRKPKPSSLGIPASLRGHLEKNFLGYLQRTSGQIDALDTEDYARDLATCR